MKHFCDLFKRQLASEACRHVLCHSESPVSHLVVVIVGYSVVGCSCIVKPF